MDPRTDAEKASVIAKEEAGRFALAGRNDLCPCGSLIKFKKCHGSEAKKAEVRKEGARERRAAPQDHRRLSPRDASLLLLCAVGLGSSVSLLGWQSRK